MHSNSSDCNSFQNFTASHEIDSVCVVGEWSSCEYFSRLHFFQFFFGQHYFSKDSKYFTAWILFSNSISIFLFGFSAKCERNICSPRKDTLSSQENHGFFVSTRSVIFCSIIIFRQKIKIFYCDNCFWLLQLLFHGSFHSIIFANVSVTSVHTAEHILILCLYEHEMMKQFHEVFFSSILLSESQALCSMRVLCALRKKIKKVIRSRSDQLFLLL